MKWVSTKPSSGAGKLARRPRSGQAWPPPTARASPAGHQQPSASGGTGHCRSPCCTQLTTGTATLPASQITAVWPASVPVALQTTDLPEALGLCGPTLVTLPGVVELASG